MILVEICINCYMGKVAEALFFFNVQNNKKTFGKGSDRCIPNSLNYKEEEEAQNNQTCKIILL